MKSREELPTDENLDKAAFLDLLERNTFIEDFIRLLSSVEGHYSIALDGRWGSGKTFFVKQTERIIRQLFRHKKEFNICYTVKANLALCKQFKNLFKMDDVRSHPMMTLYYDAWQHDNQQDALLSLVFEIVKLLPAKDPRLKAKLSKRDKFQKSIVPITQGIFNHLVGLDFKSIKNEFDDQESDILLKIRNQETLDSLLNDFFKNILPNDNTRLVIFIDELDRCKPDYAIQLLERIKHYIISEQITFVFSVNIEQLQHTIKRFYGDDFDACSYLDRFFDFHVALSVPKLSLARWGSKKSIIFSPWCHFLAEEMNFDLRKQGHFYELIQQTLHTQGDSILVMPIPETIELYFKNKVDKNIIEKDNVYEKLKFTFSFIKCFFVPLVLALRMNNISDYYSFIDGKNKKQLEILINYLMKFKEEETSQNALMVNICSILDLSSSFSKICINANINEIINKLYDFLFTRIYDDYTQTTDSFEPFIINDIILFNYHIKNEIFGLLSFTTTSHSFIV